MLRQTGVVVTLDGEILQPGMPLLHADDLAAVRGWRFQRHCWVRDSRACLVKRTYGMAGQSARLMDLPRRISRARWWQRSGGVASTADEGALP